MTVRKEVDSEIVPCLVCKEQYKIIPNAIHVNEVRYNYVNYFIVILDADCKCDYRGKRIFPYNNTLWEYCFVHTVPCRTLNGILLPSDWEAWIIGNPWIMCEWEGEKQMNCDGNKFSTIVIIL